MKRPTLAVIGQFALIVFAVLLVAKLARVVLFDNSQEALGAVDLIIAISIAVTITGGWLRKT